MKAASRAREEWSRYRVGEPSTRSNWTNPACVDFDTVYHICHIAAAHRVFEDGRIRRSLIFDESRLKNTRACVSWVSSNLWAPGSIYGNVRFDFKWSALIEGKRFYWVEDMRTYRPRAYRILITSEDRADLQLVRYDPTKGDGPLFHDQGTDTWYRNGEFTGEFLIDDDLSLDECRNVGFVDHHAKICRIPACQQLGWKGVHVGAAILARLLAHGLSRWNYLFLDRTSKRKCLNKDAQAAWEHLRKALKVGRELSGRLNHRHSAAAPLIAAILDRYGWDRPRGRRQLCNLFKDTRELRLALAGRVARAFGLPSKRALE